MAWTGSNPAKRPNSSLFSATDFSDFQTSGMPESPPDEDLDSDIEDAIYANMYFDATSNQPSQYEGPSSSGTSGTLVKGEGSRMAREKGEGSDTSSESGVWNISVTMASFPKLEEVEQQNKSKDKSNKKGKDKLKRKSKSKHLNHQTKRARLTDASDTANTNADASDTANTSAGPPVEVIDLTADTDVEVVDEVVDLTAEVMEVRKREKKAKKASKRTSRRRDEESNAQGKDGSSNLISKKPSKVEGPGRTDSSSPVSDIKMLFTHKEKPVPSRKSSSEEEGSDSISVSGQGSSVESGELRSGERSRVNSDMDLCSDTSTGGGEVKDDWKISEKDRLGREAYERLHGQEDSAGRYYGSSKAKCANCKQKGHAGKDCPWPKRHTVCYLCAGHKHVISTCLKNICTYCYQPKHKGSSCRVSWAGLATVCTRCFMKGHHASVCPDLWRQYHHTTYQSTRLETIPGSLQRSSKKVYCCNCAQKGHYGFECTCNPPRGNPAPHLPLVASYDVNCWPPRDWYSLSIIEKARSSSATPSNKATPPNEGRGLLGSRPPHLEAIKEGDDESEYYSTSDSKKTNRNSKKSRKRKRRSGSEPDLNIVRDRDEGSAKRRDSLVVTVDGRGSKTVLEGQRSDRGLKTAFEGRRADLDRPSSLHNSMRSPVRNHIHDRDRVKPLPLLPMPTPSPVPGGAYPREPHMDHHRTRYGSGLRHMDERRYSLDSVRYEPERRLWRHDVQDHTPSPYPPQRREGLSRSLSSGESHLPPGPPHLHQRRFSEHLELRNPRSYHEATSRLHNATHTPPDHMTPYRGGGGASRGFRMSDEGARHAEFYREGPGTNRSPASGRRYSHGQFRH